MTVACPRCLDADILPEMIMPLPDYPPTGKDGSGPCCHDCASAETVVRVVGLMTWHMARIAVGNDRMESLRLPGALIGLARMGFMRGNDPGDLERHHAFLVAAGVR